MRKARRENVINLLVVGQTPPPYVGQMLSIESLVNATYADIQIHHVRMNYSRTIDEIGSVQLRKLFHLVRIMLESGYKICRHRIDVIYYPPGAQRVPLFRDIATLLALRVFRRKLILVFHASGLSRKCLDVERAAPLASSKRRSFIRKREYKIHFSIRRMRLSSKRKRSHCAPNGVADQFEKYDDWKTENSVPVILFVGMVRADKGVDVILAAARLLNQQGRRFLIRIVGEFSSQEYRRQLLREIEESDLNECVEFCGRRVNDEKWQLYHSADIFCFPSHHPSESFGNVLLEAMMFKLPVVATRWRGIPDIVVDGETGFLVEVNDAAAIAEVLARLLDDEGLRERMGRKGRERYLRNYTMDKYLERTRQIVLEVAQARDSTAAHRYEKSLAVDCYDDKVANKPANLTFDIMKKILITGSSGLVGSEAARFFAARNYNIVGIDNDMRATFFGPEASTKWNLAKLVDDLGPRYSHHEVDIRDVKGADGHLQISQAAAGDHSYRCPALTRLGGPGCPDGFHDQCKRYVKPARTEPSTLPRSTVYLYVDEQGLWRYAKQSTSLRTRDALGDR